MSGNKPPADAANFQSKSDEESENDSGMISMLQQLFARRLNLGPNKDEPQEKVLSELSLEGIGEYMKSDKCQNVIAMVGAGISTSAGIPDFRSPGSGLYDNLEKYNLPTPECVFDISFFKENPKPFYQLAKELFPGKFKPTPCHYFLKLLEEKGLLLRLYSQNIDTLERIAGISGDKLIEAHGTFFTSHCVSSKCKEEYSLEYMKEKIFKDELPVCKCGSSIKPDIVFFGENLPEKFFKNHKEDFPKCDLLIIIGTSLTVQPFAGLVDEVSFTTPRLLINKEKCGQSSQFSRLLGYCEGLDFDSENNIRDVAYEGLCDDGCKALAEVLGWGDELKTLIEREHSKIDGEELEKGDLGKSKPLEEKVDLGKSKSLEKKVVVPDKESK